MGLVTFAEVKVGKRLGLQGRFLIFSNNDGYELLFQSDTSGEKFYIRSQRETAAKNFKTLEAIKNAIETAGLEVWPLQIFGDFKLKPS